MPNYSRGDVLLVRYPFTDLSGVKVRPAVVVHAPHPSQDSFVVPLHDPPQPDCQIYRPFLRKGFSKFGKITARMVGALIFL